MTLQQVTSTTNFTIWYEDSITGENSAQNLANILHNADALALTCETDFDSLTTGGFGVTGGFGTANRVNVQLSRPTGGGAANQGYNSGGNTSIQLDAQAKNNYGDLTAEVVRMLFVAEFAEVLMDYRNQVTKTTTWNRGDSSGEGLSQLCAILQHPTGYYTYYPYAFVNYWLQWPYPSYGNPPIPTPTDQRHDYITNPQPNDTIPYSFGCALLFLYYLKDQLGRPVADIIQKGGNTLEATYQNLTGKTGAYTAFRQLLDQYFPIGNTPVLNTDDPFPLLDVSRRHVVLNISETTVGMGQKIAGGTARLQMCFGPKTYAYEIDSTPKVVACVASGYGFGQPLYTWQINGIDVKTSGVIKPQIWVFVDDPTTVNQGTNSFTIVPIDCTLTSTPFTSTLSLSFPSTNGHFGLTIQASASEAFASTNVSSATALTEVDTEQVVWEPQYYADLTACLATRLEQLEHLVEIIPNLNIILTLPDPAPDYGLVFSQLQQISTGLDAASIRAPKAAKELRTAVTKMLKISPRALRAFSGKTQKHKERQSRKGSARKR